MEATGISCCRCRARKWGVRLLLLTSLLVHSDIWLSPSLAEESQSTHAFDLKVGKGILINLPSSSDTVFVSDPNVADVQVPFSDRVFLFGKATGETTLFAIDDTGGVVLAKDVRVSHNLEALRRVLTDRFPTATLKMTSAKGSLLLSGEVDTPEQAAAIVETTYPFLGEGEKLINRLQVGTPNKVRLYVRLMEASKDINEEFGINWQSVLDPSNFVVSLLTGRDFLISDSGTTRNGSQSALGLSYSRGDIQVNGVIDFLEGQGMVSILAEPTLTALSGKSAKFLAGGEFPYPSPASGDSAATVEFKPFGISLEFEPKIFDANTIGLAIRSEVSELSTSSVSIDGTSIPQTLTRQVETEIELANGQSFAIGGLFQKTTRNSISQTPGLGDIPVLGKLFQSKEFLENKTELVIVVTPQIVPNVGSKLDATYLSSLRPLSEAEYLFAEKLSYDYSEDAPSLPRLNGQAGFLY